MTIPSRLLHMYSPARDAIYAMLLAHPGRTWSVRGMADALLNESPLDLPAGLAVTRDAVRANLYLLLADGVVVLVPRRTVVTMRLTDQGAAALSAIRRRWQARGLTQP